MKRLEGINELILCIGENHTHSDHHKFFHSRVEDGTFRAGKFIFAENGFLYYIDPYREKKVRPLNYARKQQIYFSGGGVMWDILKDFGRFIMTGEKGFLRDYKEVWGFEYENTMNVRKKAQEVGFIERIDYLHERFA